MDTSKCAIHAENLNVQYRMVTHRHTTFKEYALSYFQGRGPQKEDKAFHALKDVNLEIYPGEAVALIGHNGSGKSTLLKSIAGIIPLSSGSLETRGRIAPMIELGAGFDFELSGIENIRLSCLLMGLTEDEIEARLDSIVEFSDLGEFIYAPLKNYSSGMAARIGFACATAVDPDILLVDEVLAVGDQNFTKKCLARIRDLQRRGTTIILVSHDMGTIRRFCQRAYILEKGVVAYSGSIDGALSEHDRIMEQRFEVGVSAAQRAELVRQRRLERSQFDVHKPTAQVSMEFFQGGTPVKVVDIAKGFSLRFHIKLKDAMHIEPKVSFGIALTKGEAVITGFNNIDLGYESLNPPEGKGDLTVSVTYDLSEGMPALEAGYYGILFGIHDNDLSREIFFERLGEMPVQNSLRGINRHQYVFDASHHVKNFELMILN